ncbi:MAG: hypothetical protein A3G34_09930 [Candidatus Lindowbacteria bacterium RIFCSPLOWO2_12_FULL_62_27]|nr:MAG: hypothetical protein A3G34_09930 [Candidatus Lindowbacteria bacterium RIFCSPLOWO2_12_FULL_62_27]OGH61560.1 MAG: hypothetical protein A3I06_02940 [Candidatus Lindowbacteria bacterium RIFCSPLOWO2_02_FULL_62_12]
MRVTRKGEVVTGGSEGQSGAGAEVVRSGKPVPMADVVGPAKGQPFVDRLFSAVLSEIHADLETLLGSVDRTAKALVAQPNQVNVDAYKEAVSHFLALIIDQTSAVREVQALKRAKDGKPKMLLRVEIINQKLADLAAEILRTQKPVIDLVANRLDEIRGLLVDLYDWKSPG